MSFARANRSPQSVWISQKRCDPWRQIFLMKETRLATLSSIFGSRGSFFAYWIFHCDCGCRIALVHAYRTRHYISISEGDVSRCSCFSRSETRSFVSGLRQRRCCRRSKQRKPS
ncbi:hypothetical protein MUK42_05132 [Musa troglodytarum]|uniref:Uncharacterized protein n=1 Tax=Musa troglodytarum TaxID=320322 RepID=A0A9E7ER80_9LILI|nr:hypothetical protein MUK42_05132 [Musa troglodytarum]